MKRRFFLKDEPPIRRRNAYKVVEATGEFSKGQNYLGTTGCQSISEFLDCGRALTFNLDTSAQQIVDLSDLQHCVTSVGALRVKGLALLVNDPQPLCHILNLTLDGRARVRFLDPKTAQQRTAVAQQKELMVLEEGSPEAHAKLAAESEAAMFRDEA